MTHVPSLEVVRSAVRAHTEQHRVDRPRPVLVWRPVVTISRQAGIDTATFVERLAPALDAQVPGTTSWVAFDRELVERVAEDHHLSRDLVASMDEHDKTWFEHLLGGLAGRATGADLPIKTARTIRALARMGRSIIVGRGGQCILKELPMVVHVRLVAPSAWRAEVYAEATGVRPSDAERAIREQDHERERFLKHHFNRDWTDPELYHLVINVARVEEAAAVDLVGRVVESIRPD